MSRLKKAKPTPESLRSRDEEAIRHLKQSIESGKPWFISLLEAIALWGSPEEVYKGRHYRYLTAGEAFDWLLLAERLCEEPGDRIPVGEKTALLFYGKVPLELKHEDFRRLIGHAKYRAYLNYFYGIIAEEALQLATEEAVRKEYVALGMTEKSDIADEAYRRNYGASWLELFEQFRKERKYRASKTVRLETMKEFTYWLFKYRLSHADQARVASDTKIALGELHKQWNKRKIPPF